MLYERVMVNSERWFSLEDLPDEEWRDIKDYEGLYQISNYGRIRSCSRKYSKNTKILKSITRKDGYVQVTLRKNKTSETFLVHILVANTFILNPHCLPHINHKDEIKNNNMLYNLEWCTPKYNNNYGTKIQRTVIKQNKKVNQYNLDGTYVKTWNSIKEAENHYHCKHISSCCNLKKSHTQSCGFQWRFYQGNINNIKPCVKNTLEKPVVQRNIEGDFVKVWKSFHQISRETNYNWQNINKCCRGLRKTAYGYKWEYAEK